MQNRNGNLNVPYLYENGDKVVVNWNWLDNDRNSNNISPPRWGSFALAYGALAEEAFVSCPFHYWCFETLQRLWYCEENQ
ncbi:MAG: hypothetical protein AAB667_01270 [Patescibacteria group bacterium]